MHEPRASLAKSASRWARFSWCLFDFANSGFPTVIVTAVYVIYFKSVVVGTQTPGQSDQLWGGANAIGAAVVFLLAPVLGAVADASGRKKQFWVGFTALCVLSTAALSMTGQGTVALAMVLFVLALVGFEGACIFYNSFLPELVPENDMETLSGAGWALGYIGGLLCLLFALPMAKSGWALPYVPLLVAVWFALFSVPAFAVLRETGRRLGSIAWRAGIAQLRQTLVHVGQKPNMGWFLLAYFFYNNAVATIIVFAVAFSRDSLKFETAQSIILVVVMNVVAAPAAYLFGLLAKRVGARQTIVVTLWLWLVVVGLSLVAAWPGLLSLGSAQTLFWGVSALASLCIGAIQATSRTFVGQSAPPGRSGEYFGFLAFAGKGSAVLGPLVFGMLSAAFGSQLPAVVSIGVFFMVGLGFMAKVTNPTVQTGSGG